LKSTKFLMTTWYHVIIGLLPYGGNGEEESGARGGWQGTMQPHFPISKGWGKVVVFSSASELFTTNHCAEGICSMTMAGGPEEEEVSLLVDSAGVCEVLVVRTPSWAAP
jgi:hypothetical protein